MHPNELFNSTDYIIVRLFFSNEINANHL